VQITVHRDGQRQILSVNIGTLTEDKLASMGPTQGAEALGLAVQTLTPQLAEQFGAKPGEGVVVTSVKAGSIAALAGIEPGAVILQVNRDPVRDAVSFKRAIEQSPGKRVLLLIRKDGMQQFLVLNW
jgi:serine protease Do